jgi:Leucine-rich repeat (LRR) protein
LNIGAKQLPEFKGAWREFSRIEISSCPNLENLSGLHVLPDLRLIKLKNLRAMHNLFPPSAPALPTLSHLHAKNVRVLAPAGFESMPSLSKLEWIGCSLDSMTGVESLQVLKGVDLTGSDLRSIAPFASLPILQSIRVSKCDSIKPKPARVLLEGDELARELSRATGAPRYRARGDFLKVVELLSSGNVDDTNQAVHFISVLTDDERGRLLSGAGINPETGWIRLPFLEKLKDEESQGLPQFRIIYALRNVDLAAARILESVDTIVLNPCDQQTTSTLCFGARMDKLGLTDSVAQGDLVLEEFPSLEALPSLKNIKKIVVNTVSRFSLRGVTNFPALESLTVLGVNAIEHIESLGGHANLKNLELSESKITGLHEIGRLPALETLACDQNFETLHGINNFPELKRMRTRSIDDISELFEISKKRKKKIALKESFGWSERGWPLRGGFELV